MASTATAYNPRRRKCQHHWTDDERAILRRDYDGTLATRQRLAVQFGVSESAVRGQVINMGLTTRIRRRRWTDSETQLLVEMIQTSAASSIARRMGRTVAAVQMRAQQLGLSRRRGRDDWYTQQEVCQILGVNDRWVQRRVGEGALVASREGQVWRFSQGALRAFIVGHCGELTGRNVDLVQFVEIMGA